jgi:tetratricopeptide (TPR) repeat protein
LVARRIVEEVRNGSEPLYDFSHDKLRALVHEETSLARQRLLHRRVAEALAGRVRGGRDPGPLAARISHHYRLAGRDAEAAEYSRLAGDHARSIYANGDALAHYEAALALGHPRAGELHEAIGDLHTLLGEYAAALTHYEAAAAFLDGQEPAGLEHKLGNVHARRGDRDVAESHYEAALAAFAGPEERPMSASGREGEQARLHADWSLLAHRRGETAWARGLAENALELAEAAGDARALTRAHNVLGVVAAGVGDLATARRHLGESLALAGDLGDPDARVAALNNLALVHGTGGETDRAIELTGEALALCASVGDRHREAALHNNLADLLHAAGRREESMKHLKKAVAIFAEIGEDGALQPEIWKLSEW